MLSFIYTAILGLDLGFIQISITNLIILITFILSIYAESNPLVKKKWMLNPYNIYHHGESYRFLSSGFIHDGYIHLGFNMLVLHSFGHNVEYILYFLLDSIAPFTYLGFYILAVIISGFPSYLKNLDKIYYNSLGASGAVSAVVFASILYQPLGNIGLLFLPPEISLPGFVFGILYLMYSAYMARNASDFINHDAHLYGALFGIIFFVLIHPQVVFQFLDQLSQWEGFF